MAEILTGMFVAACCRHFSSSSSSSHSWTSKMLGNSFIGCTY